MKLSPVGLAFIRRWEGCRLALYQDAAGLATIGYGHLLTRSELNSGKMMIGGEPVRYRSGLTPAQARLLLLSDAAKTVAGIESFIHVPLSQAQADALISFAFNAGTDAFARSTLLKRLNAGDYDAVPVQLMRWVYVAGKVNRGLKRRRAAEVRLWEAQEDA